MVGPRSRRAAGAVALIAAISGGLAVDLGAPIDALAEPPSVTTLASVATDGTQGNEHSGSTVGGEIDVSGDGDVIVFTSQASNLAPEDEDHESDVFARDLDTGVTTLVSIATDGTAAGGGGPRVSEDGRFVVFTSSADTLVPDDTNSWPDVFLRDLVLGTTERVSVASGGGQAASRSAFGDVSADGRFVVFSSAAANLVPDDTNSSLDVFVRDRQLGTTERVSVAAGGAQASGHSDKPSISSDGGRVVFESVAANLVDGDSNGLRDVFLHDRSTASTARVSLDADGAQIADCCGASTATISGSGRFVTFMSQSPQLSGGPSVVNAYVRDTATGTTELASVPGSGPATEVTGTPSSSSGITDDGRYVVFTAWRPTIPGVLFPTTDVYLRDRLLGSTTLVSSAGDGGLGSGTSWLPAISGDGSVVTFASLATNLVPQDLNDRQDVFAMPGPTAAPADPAVYIDDVDVAEGRAGRLIFRFEPALEQTSCFRTRYVDGTASTPGDYDPNPGRICIPAGAEDAVTGISILADGEIEDPETFTVELYDLEHLSAGDTSATWTIVDHPAIVTPGGLGGLEGDSGSQIPCVPVHLDQPHPRPVVLDWETVDSGGHAIATAGEDYREASGRLVIPPGETEGCVEVEVYGDTDLEPRILYGEWLPIYYRPTDRSQNVDIDTAPFFGLGLIIIGEDDW